MNCKFDFLFILKSLQVYLFLFEQSALAHNKTKIMHTLIAVVLTLTITLKVSAETIAYIGTYTQGDSEGIYRSVLNPDTGALTEPVLAAKVVNPSFLAIHPNGQFLYAVAETSTFAGEKSGGLSAFKIERNGDLTLLNHRNTMGGAPCHVGLDPAGKVVLVTNYSGGSVTSFPIRKDGSLGEVGGFVQHVGGSEVTQRQQGPHAHSVNVDSRGKRAIVADLGKDQLLIYRLDTETAELAPNKPPYAETKPGGGPRHFSFHPNGKFAYANLELTREVCAMTYDAETGKLDIFQTLPTTPAGAEGSTAECLVHPNGKFLYVSNRGHNSIAAFSINQSTGNLAHLENESTQGEIPRGFGIDPSGRFLVVGNQRTGNVIVLEIDQATGKLEPTGHEVKVDRAVNVRFLER